MTGPDHPLDHDEIAERAYANAHNGGTRQNDEENWLQAEDELRAEKAGAAPPKKPRTRLVSVKPSPVPEAD